MKLVENPDVLKPGLDPIRTAWKSLDIACWLGRFVECSKQICRRILPMYLSKTPWKFLSKTGCSTYIATAIVVENLYFFFVSLGENVYSE